MEKQCPYLGKCPTEQTLNYLINILKKEIGAAGTDEMSSEEYFKEAEELLERKTMPSYGRALLLIQKGIMIQTKKAFNESKSARKLLANYVCQEKIKTCPTYKFLNK